MRGALATGKFEALLALLGPEHEAELVGGDPAQRRVELRRLAAAAERGLALRPAADGGMIVLVGPRAWPLPVPLVEEAGGWRFDTERGLEEIVDRRIGRNELAAMASLFAYWDAQRTYAAFDRDGDEVLEYAQRIRSTPGKTDGLFWEIQPGEEPSPLGPFIAEAGPVAAEQRAGEPFFGYRFKILTRQGPHAPGGAHDYVINGNMIAGYAMVAWPAQYGNSGIMTFQISHQGRIFEKDLGPETERLAAAIEAYDPDPSWSRVAE
ncbi:MAG: DUF2950 domain-containing protein [Geminicoccaceae bacterium]|nr:DUF2950 domain-containing protein [Geminicoccaceae bacterium]